ncbi:MAG: sulfotransferase domain-containing protein [Planctomycetes bacterium]|nr:sulfotransferase domain-containing protein [Planctomycetota bacterium]MCP4771015.1 sulfotransferase domain-containing protein [Planctomycetota bacterium]MCP4861734.1 sulfotransferase domain-containing protein [Planctomycetota bacterium]
MTSTPRPDFIIIGAMKCATSTLHVQLESQPGFHMSDPKEPNFFSDDEEYARGRDWYRGLFAEAQPGDLRGESSTHYTKSPTYPQTIARLQEEIGSAPLKVIYVMRQPVERLVSHYIHEWTQGVYSADIDSAVLKHHEMIDYGCYAKQLQPWISAFGKESVLPIFTDSVRKHPQRTLERVCEFLGYEGKPQWIAEKAEQNVSSLRMRKSAQRERLFSIRWLQWLRRTFLPESVRNRMKSPWMMTERPELSAESRAMVEGEFDRDLAQLGEWFGLELTCANWKQVTAETEPRWKQS